MSKDTFKIKGSLTLRVFKDGVLIETRKKNNLVVNTGLNVMAALIGGTTDNNHPIAKIGFGVGSATPIATDTTLTGLFTKAAGAKTYPSTGTVNIAWTLETYEYNSTTIREYGLFVSTSGGDVLFSRLLDTPIAKDSGIRLEGDWTIAITNT